MPTKHRNLAKFRFHKQELADDGYNYYFYIHQSGQIIVMREEIATKDVLYANGGYNDLNWAYNNRDTLTYDLISKI